MYTWSLHCIGISEIKLQKLIFTSSSWCSHQLLLSLTNFLNTHRRVWAMLLGYGFNPDFSVSQYSDTLVWYLVTFKFIEKTEKGREKFTGKPRYPWSLNSGLRCHWSSWLFFTTVSWTPPSYNAHCLAFAFPACFWMSSCCAETITIPGSIQIQNINLQTVDAW